MHVFNLVGKNFRPETDQDLFLDEDTIENLQEGDVSMAHLLARIGKFASVGEAKRNGWAKPIPTGWTEITIGKGAKRTDIFIWNPVT